jgi:hypothetical protein
MRKWEAERVIVPFLSFDVHRDVTNYLTSLPNAFSLCLGCLDRSTRQD